MLKITNDSNQVKLYKLDNDSAAHGPLIAIQLGYAPGDITFTQSVFLLRRDGRWADFVALGATSNAEMWDACLFDKPLEVLNLLNKDSIDAEVCPMEIDPEALASWLQRTAGFTAQQRIDRLLEIYKERLARPHR